VEGSPDAANFDPRKWGYATEEQLRNWRLYKRYANGPADERGGALISLTNWFLGAVPNAVQATGGNFSYKDGRDVNDQIFATLEYPNGRIATLSLLESNGFEGSYTQFMGTKGTLIVGQGEALLFTEEGSHPSTVGVAKLNSSQPVVNASASRSEESSNHSALASGVGTGHSNPMEAFQSELAGFCGAIRSGAPLRSDAAHAYEVARTCTAIRESVANSRTQYA
jgi:predicted dehydrogenase